jgi:chitodextrinase
MATNLYQRGLQAHYEANELPGADGSAVTTFTDLSVYERHLTASTAKPLIKANAINSKKSVIWDGSKNPLVYTGSFRLSCGFMVVKIDGNFDNTYEGVLSSPATYGILTGIGGTALWYDFLYDFYEYRLNDRIYPKTAAPAPISSFGIIFFRFWRPITVDGIQIGQDRGFTDRKFDGEVALLALYDRRMCEGEIRNNIQSIAASYQIALPDVFPYQGTKSDPRAVGKRVLSDGQDEPVTRVKRGGRTLFDLSFAERQQTERKAAAAFWDDRFPEKRFIYRDYENIPPEDTICRIPENSEFKWNGGLTVNNNSYAFQVFESVIAPATAIPGAPVIPEEEGDSIVGDTEAPTTPGSFALDFENVPTTSTVSLLWDESTDNVEVEEYQIQYATNSSFTTGTGAQNFSAPATGGTVTGLASGTAYWFRIRAKDTSGNYSAYSSSVSTSTEEESETYDPVAALGSKLIVYLDAEQIAGADGDPVSTIPNTGTENDWTKILGTVTLAVESGKKAIYVQSGGTIEGGTNSPAQTGTMTLYAVVKAVTDPTENRYWLHTFKFSGIHAVIVGFTDNKFTWYSEGDVMGDADTSAYKLIKVTNKSTATGEWRIGSDGIHASKFRVLIGTNAALSSGEATDLEAWLNTRL